MEKLLSILVAILIFCVIIVFHEFGHLLLAKKNGISVPEFSLGFGPKLFGFKIGETEYTFRIILLGGACRMLGEDDDTKDERAFNSKSVGARFATVLAGPVANFILAFILAVIVIGIVGYDPACVLKVNEGSAAEAAGLAFGDIITEYDGKKIDIGRDLAAYETFNEYDGRTIGISYLRDDEVHETKLTPVLNKTFKLGFYYTDSDDPAIISNVISDGVMYKAGIRKDDIITSFNGEKIGSGHELSEYLSLHPLDGTEIGITIERDGKSTELYLVPEYKEEYITGVTYNYQYREKTTSLKVLKYSLIEVRYWIVNTIKSFGQLFTGKLGSDDVGGPVRVVSEMENTVKESKSDGALYVALNLLNWAILLSANLGVVNLFPIPGLDGGRLVFLIIEAIRRKPIPPEKEGFVHFAGFVLLMILMVFIFYNDIRNVFFR